MPNSTVEYWDADGVSLQTFTQNLKTWGGSREGVPPLRGEDLKIPYMRGSRFVRKVPDSRTLTLEGWLLGTEEVDTVIRQNRYSNSLPTTSNAGYSNSPGTTGVAVTNRTTADTPFGNQPVMRTTWTTGSSGGGSAGHIATTYITGGVGHTMSLTMWVHISAAVSHTVLLRYRDGNTAGGQITPPYRDSVAGEWVEWKIEGLSSTIDFTSLQAYVLVNNVSAIPTNMTITTFAPTFEDGPYAQGVLYMGQHADTETTAMKLLGPSSNFPTRVLRDFKPSKQAARNNWRALRTLLWNPRKQFNLTRRWYDAAGTLRTATARAQFTGGMEPDVEAGGTRMRFTIDLFLADPFFYGPEETVTLTRSTQSKTILGDWSSVKARVELAGSQGPTAITVNGENAHGLTYTTAIGSGVTAVLDIENFTAKEGANGKTASVTHSGSRFWLEPEPGTQSFTASGTGAGTIKYIYQPAWF